MGIADMMSLLCVFIYCVTMFTRWPPLLWQVVEVILPVTVNLLLVLVIIYNLYNTKDDINKLLSDSVLAAKERDNRRIGYTLVCIVITFILCNLPQMAYIIRRDYIGSRLSNEKDSYMQTHAIIASVFQVINHTANVFLYCFVNKHYRNRFMRMLRVGRPNCACLRLLRGYRSTSTFSTSSTFTGTRNKRLRRVKTTLTDLELKARDQNSSLRNAVSDTDKL
ncbi:hypothetical protein EB796_006679 [Bugula neritina]|uniref:G-protein coupled receptors family 1 profile domain-containing protein n=1 Tax=Bugula neritina TaxID=10212 RepID=A0A7J7KAQ0_BUGNE|nr:hypothetical protein EB796_006679 [Bugula neritina]